VHEKQKAWNISADILLNAARPEPRANPAAGGLSESAPNVATPDALRPGTLRHCHNGGKHDTCDMF
jgi:hypothetical protein